MNILLTRPVEDSQKLAEYLKSISSHKFTIHPLLKIEFIKTEPTPNLQQDKNIKQIYLLTSVNSARALAFNCTENRGIFSKSIITVGMQTAEEAVNLGYKNVVSAVDETKDASEKNILDFIYSNYPAEQNINTQFNHISADVTKGGLEKNLLENNYNYNRIIMYKSIPAQFSNQLKMQIINDEINAITLYSPRSAKIFVEQIIANSLQSKMKETVAFCFSKNVAEVISQLQFRQILIPPVTNTENFASLIADYR